MGPATALLCLAATAMLVVAVGAAPKDSLCSENDKACKTNGDCCGGCCHDGKCVAYLEACTAGVNPCNTYDCPQNKVCYLQPVQCLQSPCLPIPACKSADSDYD